MDTLIVYDNTGKIFYQMTNQYPLPGEGIQHMETVVPEGKVVVKVDTSVNPHKVVLDDIPPSEMDQLKQTVADLTEIVLSGGM